MTAACLSFRGVSCRVCEEACEQRAIRFKLMTGGRALPLVAEESCIGCADCLDACPEGALRLIDRPLDGAPGKAAP